MLWAKKLKGKELSSVIIVLFTHDIKKINLKLLFCIDYLYYPYVQKYTNNTKH